MLPQPVPASWGSNHCQLTTEETTYSVQCKALKEQDSTHHSMTPNSSRAKLATIAFKRDACTPMTHDSVLLTQRPAHLRSSSSSMQPCLPRHVRRCHAPATTTTTKAREARETGEAGERAKHRIRGTGQRLQRQPAQPQHLPCNLSTGSSKSTIGPTP